MNGEVIFRIVMTILNLGVVGLMAWDQTRRGQMNREKWLLAGLLLVVLMMTTWGTQLQAVG